MQNLNTRSVLLWNSLLGFWTIQPHKRGFQALVSQDLMPQASGRSVAYVGSVLQTKGPCMSPGGNAFMRGVVWGARIRNPSRQVEGLPKQQDRTVVFVLFCSFYVSLCDARLTICVNSPAWA